MKTVPVFLAAMLVSQAVCAQGGAFDPCVKSARNPLDIYESSRCADQNAQRERDRQRRAEPGGPGVAPAPGAAPRILSPEEVRRGLEQATPKVDPVQAQNAAYRQARAHWERGNLPDWVAGLTHAARMGHGGAMRELGDLYMSRLGADLGLRARPGTVVVCLDKATRLGDPEARTRMQKTPFPVPSYGDPAPSLPPDQDCPQPTSRDRYAIALRESKATDPVDELAQQGWAEAQLANAARYARLGDDRAALRWYRKAAEQGLPFGAAELDALARRVVPEPPTPEEVADATRRDSIGQEHLRYGRKLAALHYLRVAAALGNANAMHGLGFAYEKGQLGLRADPDAAVIWYRRSGERGLELAARRSEQLAADLAQRRAAAEAAAAAERYHAEMRAQLAAPKPPAPPPPPPPASPPLPERPAAPPATPAAPVPVAGGTGPFDDINFTAVAPPNSGWSWLADAAEGAVFIDRASMVRRGSYVLVWELSDLRLPVPTGTGTSWRSRKRLAEYQCDGARGRTLGAYGYALSMGAGDTVASVTSRGVWTPVQPHVLAAAVMKAVC